MKPAELKELVTKMVMNQTDQALVTDTLETIVKAYTEKYTVNESLQEEKNKYEEQIKNLQEVNMKFFTQLQTPQQKEEKEEKPQELNLEEIFKI